MNRSDPPSLGKRDADGDQPIGFRIAEGVEDQAIDQSANQRSAADADRERDHGRHGEPRTVDEQPEGLAKILERHVDVSPGAAWKRMHVSERTTSASASRARQRATATPRRRDRQTRSPRTAWRRQIPILRLTALRGDRLEQFRAVVTPEPGREHHQEEAAEAASHPDPVRRRRGLVCA